MKVGFFVVIFSITLLINFYVILRGWQALSALSVLKSYFLVIMIVLFLTMMGSMIFSGALPLGVAKQVSFVGYTYMILFLYLLLSFVIIDVIRIINHFLPFLPFPMHLFRFWAMNFSLAIIAVALIIGNYNFNHPAIITLNLTSEKPLQNKEIKIVAVSDIHLGISIDKARLKSYVTMINKLKPDIVLLAGDISDREMRPVIKQKMEEEFRSIIAPLGVYAINGNHEHYSESPDATAIFLTQAGVKVLRDEIVLIDSGLYIIGREDRTHPERKSLTSLLENYDTNKPMILLDHQPFHLEEAEQNNIDFQFSGHTHNGQFFPGNLLVKRMYEKAHGYLKKGKTNYYISSGLGLWGPQYRIGTQSEIVVINFKY